jgi:hypothetical protein
VDSHAAVHFPKIMPPDMPFKGHEQEVGTNGERCHNGTLSKALAGSGPSDTIILRATACIGIVQQLLFSQTGKKADDVVPRDLLRNVELPADSFGKVRRVVPLLEKFDDTSTDGIQAENCSTVNVEQDAAVWRF